MMHQNGIQQLETVNALAKKHPSCSCLVFLSWYLDYCLQGKVRLDAYLAAKLPDASRAKIQASIKAGRVSINGSPVAKAAQQLRGGEVILAELLPPGPCTVSSETSLSMQHTLLFSTSWSVYRRIALFPSKLKAFRLVFCI
jgi:23S rRNA-/tRNA-specific pseudouridylate synthase